MDGLSARVARCDRAGRRPDGCLSDSVAVARGCRGPSAASLFPKNPLAAAVSVAKTGDTRSSGENRLERPIDPIPSNEVSEKPGTVHAVYFDDSTPLWSLVLAAGLSWWARRVSGYFSLILSVLAVWTLVGAIDHAFDRIDRFL